MGYHSIAYTVPDLRFLVMDSKKTDGFLMREKSETTRDALAMFFPKVLLADYRAIEASRRALAQVIFDEWTQLHRMVGAHFSTLRKKWQKMKPAARHRLILKVAAQVPSGDNAFVEAARLAIGQHGQPETILATALSPSITQELLEQDEALIKLMWWRGTCAPDTFILYDISNNQVSSPALSGDAPYICSSRHMRFTAEDGVLSAETYGKIQRTKTPSSLEVALPPNQRLLQRMSIDIGLPAMFGQAMALRLLAGFGKAILGSLSCGAPEPSPFTSSYLAETRDYDTSLLPSLREAGQYGPPDHISIDALVSLASARADVTEQFCNELRGDAEAFLVHLNEWKKLSDSDSVALEFMLRYAYDTADSWRYISRYLTTVQATYPGSAARGPNLKGDLYKPMLLLSSAIKFMSVSALRSLVQISSRGSIFAKAELDTVTGGSLIYVLLQSLNGFEHDNEREHLGTHTFRILDGLDSLIQRADLSRVPCIATFMRIFSDVAQMSFVASRIHHVHSCWAQSGISDFSSEEEELNRVFVRPYAWRGEALSMVVQHHLADQEVNDVLQRRPLSTGVDSPERVAIRRQAEEEVYEFWAFIDRATLEIAGLEEDRTLGDLLKPFHPDVEDPRRTEEWHVQANMSSPSNVSPGNPVESKKAPSIAVSTIPHCSPTKINRTCDYRRAPTPSASVASIIAMAAAVELPSASRNISVRGSANSSSDEKVATPASITVSNSPALKTLLSLFGAGEHGGRRSLRWTDLENALKHIGFREDNASGSARSFVHPQYGSLIVHRPHPNSEFHHHVVCTLGRRLNRKFGWDERTFVGRS